MVGRIALLLLCAGAAFAQDDSGITEDETPAAGSEGSAEPREPKRTTAHPARTPGQKVATVTVKKKVYSLALPADWVLTAVDDAKSELTWEVLLPGSTKRAELALVRLDAGDPRSSPYYDAEWFASQQPAPETEVRTKPVPRIVIKQPDGEWVNLRLYVSVRNNPYTLQLSCSPDDFAQAEADMLAAARSFAAEVQIWPAIPKGHEVSREGVWLIAKAPDVTASIAPLAKALKDVERRFRRDHGPLPKDETVVVLVHATKSALEKIEPGVAESPQGFYGQWRERRLLAVPLAKDGKEQESALAYNAHGLLFMARYGDGRPGWLVHGESTVAQAEAYSGKPLPSLDEGFVSWASNVRFHLLGELEELRESDREAWRKESFFYVVALREGKYKKQYKAFLDDLTESGDAVGACARHLMTIDEEDLRNSTNKFLATRIKEEKRKHEH